MRKLSVYLLFFISIILLPGCATVSKSGNPLSINAAQDDSIAILLDQQADKLFFAKKYNEALSLYHQALTQREASLDKENLSLLYNLYNIATIHEIKKQFVTAIKLYRRADKIAKKQHEYTMSRAIQGYIAVLFEARGVIGQSKASSHQYVSMYKNFTKNKHPFLGILLHKLALFYWQDNAIKPASRYFKQSIDFIELNLGINHPYLAVVLQDYVNFLNQTSSEIHYTDLEQQIMNIHQLYPKKQHSSLYNPQATH